MKTTRLLAIGLIVGIIGACSISGGYTVSAETESYETANDADHDAEDADYDDEVSVFPLFTDLEGHWSEPWARWAYMNQFAVGYEDGSFRPDQPITEAEFLKLFYLSYGYPRGTIINEEWSAAPYRMAKSWNHPVIGLQYPVARMKPISRQAAARIVTSALGMNYNETDSIVYLLGHALLPLPEQPTLEGFRRNLPLTRVEAIQWIRMLKLKGIYTVTERPEELSDRALLTPLPEQGADLKDFIAVPVTDRDFGIADSERDLVIDFGSPRSLVEQNYGFSTGQDVFNNEMYKDVSVHYDTEGRLNSWKVDSAEESADPISIGTLNNIQSGISTLADVLQVYGTYVDISNRFGIIVSYWYENNDGVYEPRLSPYEMDNMDDGFCIAFSIDEQSLKVTSILVATAQQAWNPTGTR